MTGEAAPAGRWWRYPFDATALLSIYVFLLFAIPSRLIIAPLGGAGSPALLVGFAALFWWGWHAVRQLARARAGEPAGGGSVITTGGQAMASGGAGSPESPSRLSSQHVAVAGLVFLGAVLASYVMATIRPIGADELSTATLGVVSCLGWLGLLLLGATMITGPARLGQLRDRVVLAGGLLALLGLAQFFFHQTFIDFIQIPGLSATQPIYGVQSREGFTRPAGTAVHPIEFGVVLTTVLPMAIGRAIDGRDLRPLRRYFPAVAILLAILLSVSRSALVCAAVGILVCIPGWPRRARGPILAACAGLGVLVFLTVPGMLGSILGLFSGIGTDSSAQSRVDSWGFAFHYIAESPVLGRGFATFLPKYHILDNQYLLLLVEMGVVGLLAVVVLLITGIRSAFAAAARLPAADRVQPIALAGGIAAAASSLALFDAFSFPMVPGLLFLLLGLAGAWLRCAGPAQTVAAQAGVGSDRRAKTLVGQS